MDVESNAELNQLVSNAVELIDDTGTLVALDEVRVRYLGKNGLLTALLKQLGQLPHQLRPQAGQAINEAKQVLLQRIEQRRSELQQQQLVQRLNSERVDVTLPGRGLGRGGLHPVSRFQLVWAILMFIGVPAWTVMIALLPFAALEAQVAHCCV